ncbi:MAG: hypothetical protein D6717_05320 [Gammaproteobacteria bacterium]|nr:MAG: hypothetical protein D6717_05320 [Gammaproteobacteria bacterium]
MSDSVTLSLHSNGKLGVLHIGVLEDGSAVVAGDVHKMQDGEEYTFSRTGVTVKRSGDEFTFSRA